MDKPQSRKRVVHSHGRRRVSERLGKRRKLRGARAVPCVTKVFPEGRSQDRVDLTDGHRVGAAVRKAIGRGQQHVRRLAVPQRALLGREDRRPMAAKHNPKDGKL